MKKPLLSRSTLLLAATVLLSTIYACSPADGKVKAHNLGDYACIPCGHDCDKESYTQDGECPHCKMRLVKKASIVFNSIQPAEVCDYLASNPGIILLDVRTSNEFTGKADPDFGRLKNAINIPIQELEKRLPELDQHKGKEIIVYCSHSRRSPQASWVLTQNGFTKVTNMDGGMSEWKSVNENCKEK